MCEKLDYMLETLDIPTVPKGDNLFGRVNQQERLIKGGGAIDPIFD